MKQCYILLYWVQACYSYIVYDCKAKHRCIANNIFKIIFILNFVLQVCIHVCASKYRFLFGPEESLRCPRNGVLVNFEQSHMRLGSEFVFAAGLVRVFNN